MKCFLWDKKINHIEKINKIYEITRVIQNNTENTIKIIEAMREVAFYR